MKKPIIGIVSKHYATYKLNRPDVVESKNKRFYIGVRFHPESLYKKDEKHNKIFEAFINACKN